MALFQAENLGTEFQTAQAPHFSCPSLARALAGGGRGWGRQQSPSVMGEA